MKSKDQQLLEEAYANVVKPKYNFVRDESQAGFVELSDRTFNVNGQDVLLRRERDRDEDSEWFYFSLIDPKTKETLFKDMSEEEILAAVKY